MAAVLVGRLDGLDHLGVVQVANSRPSMTARRCSWYPSVKSWKRCGMRRCSGVGSSLSRAASRRDGDPA